MLGGHQHRAAPLAADREALHSRQTSSRIGAARPMVAYVGSSPIANVATPIISSDDDQHLLAADPVAEVPEDDAAERPGDEAERVGAERQQGRR